MDFDRRCREWTKRLTKHLEDTRVKPNVFSGRGFKISWGGNLEILKG